MIDKAGAAKVREMAERRNEGEPFAAIGRRFGLSHSTVVRSSATTFTSASLAAAGILCDEPDFVGDLWVETLTFEMSLN